MSDGTTPGPSGWKNILLALANDPGDDAAIDELDAELAEARTELQKQDAVIEELNENLMATLQRERSVVERVEKADAERDEYREAFKEAYAQTRRLTQERDALNDKVASLLRDMATVARHIEDGEYGDADKAVRQALGIAPGVDLPGRES